MTLQYLRNSPPNFGCLIASLTIDVAWWLMNLLISILYIVLLYQVLHYQYIVLLYETPNTLCPTIEFTFIQLVHVFWVAILVFVSAVC